MKKKIVYTFLITLILGLLLISFKIISGKYDKQNAIILFFKEIVPVKLKNNLRNYVYEFRTSLDKDKIENLQKAKWDQGFNGELISSKIIHHFLLNNNINCSLIDARNCIKTNSKYRGGKVQWDITNKKVKEFISDSNINITQGFIGSDKNNFTVTLGREGSDYSAAIFAYVLNAESLSIWKDVSGLLNADPKFFSNTKLLNSVLLRKSWYRPKIY